MKSKTYVFSDSAPCLEGISPEPAQAWKHKIKWYLESRYLKELDRIDGMPTEFEWKIFPGCTTLCILEEIQNFITELQCEPEQFKDRIIFMSMYNDIVRGERGNTEKCEKISVIVANYARRFRSDVGHFWDLNQRRNGTELILINEMEIGTRLLNK